MKKVLIFYAAYGGGHLSAAKSIKEHIENNYENTEISLIDCIKYINKTIDKLTTGAYREMAKKAPWAWGTVYYKSQKGVVSKISNTSNKLMARKLGKLINDINPDIIVSTHPFSSQMCAYLKRKEKINCKLATILTDFDIHDQWLVGSEYMDYYFVSNELLENALSNHGVDQNKVFCTGIPLSPRFLEKYDRKIVLDLFGLEDNKKTVLFFGGGEFGLGKNKTVDILEALLQNFNNIQAIVVAGKNIKMKASFEELVKKYNKQDSFKVLEFTDKVPELMSVSDLVITKPRRTYNNRKFSIWTSNDNN